MKKPDILEYLDLRLYLVDLYKYRKAMENGFSYERWASEMEFRSRAYLRALVVGDKPLHESLLPSLVKSLKLDDARLEYLTLLMQYSVATHADLKNTFGRQLLQRWKVLVQEVQIQDITEFLMDPLIPVLFTYLSHNDAPSNPEVIARHLNCDITRVQQGLRCLVWQKLVDGIMNDQGDIQYKTVQPFFAIPSQAQSGVLKAFHKAGLDLAKEALETPSAERKYYSAFVAMNQEQFQKVQELIQDFNQRLLGIFDSTELGEKRIYRLNTQVFPVSMAKS